jgi:hypothetical protein
VINEARIASFSNVLGADAAASQFGP